MITYTFSLLQEGAALTPLLLPGIVGTPEQIILGKHGRLSNKAVLPFWNTNPPVFESRPDGLVTVMDAYPIEPKGSDCIMLTSAKRPEGPLVMIRFMLGATVPAECRGVVISREGDPYVIGMAMVSAGGSRWPWQWRSDSLWTLSPADVVSVVAGNFAWAIRLSDGVPVVREDKSI